MLSEAWATRHSSANSDLGHAQRSLGTAVQIEAYSLLKHPNQYVK